MNVVRSNGKIARLLLLNFVKQKEAEIDVKKLFDRIVVNTNLSFRVFTCEYWLLLFPVNMTDTS